jgi:L-threonylcarbamoyladenylate synthase
MGQVVALAYERLFGLAADALDLTAVARVAAIKGRPSQTAGPKPIAVILPNRDALKLVAREISPLTSRLADRYWPGLLTLLVPAAPDLPPSLVSAGGLIGVRLPGSSPAAMLAARAGLILTATSANPAGADEALTHESLGALEGVDLVIPGAVSGPPGSTVVDATGSTPVVLRQGALTLENL